MFEMVMRHPVGQWFVRIGATYLGFRILHHEVYEVQTSEPLLIFLGMWLCGIAPATFFDSVRKVGVSVSGSIDKAAEGTEAKPAAEIESADRKDNGKGG